MTLREEIISILRPHDTYALADAKARMIMRLVEKRMVDIDEGDILRINNLKSDIEQELQVSEPRDDIWAWAPVALEFLEHFHSKITKTQCPQCKEDFRDKQE